MGRYSSFPEIVEETRTLSLKELLGYGYFQYGQKVDGVITWTSGASIKVSSYSQTRIDLSYQITSTGEGIDYSIRLVLRPSNLGKGDILFFVCPSTKEACRKLYLPSGQKYFLSRKAFPDLIYESQISNKRLRYFEKMFRSERKVEEIYEEGFRPFYNGKKTRKLKRIEALQSKGFSLADARELLKLKA